MSEVVYHLRDIDRNVVEAWRQAFADIDTVQVSAGDIFDVPAFWNTTPCCNNRLPVLERSTIDKAP